MIRLLLSAFLTLTISSCSQPESHACGANDSTAACCSEQDAAPAVVQSRAPGTASTRTLGQMKSVPNSQKSRISAAADADADSRVMIVSFDGLRPDAISADTSPTLQGLIDGGSYHPAGLAEIPAVTLPNHSSMVTGLSILNHGVLINATIEGRIQHATIFDVAKEHGVSAGFFVNKGKLGYLCAEGEADVRRITGDVDDIANECANAIRENDLRLIFLHFGEPDGAGHSQGWMSEPYLTQVTRADAALARILDAMADRDVRKETLLIITADHGGHDKTHGFPIPVDQHVPFILNGPGIAVGRILTNPVHPMDVAATALTRLGLPTASARDGHDVAEARDDYMPPESTIDDPTMLFGSLCGPVPWMFLTATLVGTRRIKRRHRE